MSKKFEQLSDFILKQMKMSHIYQPTMLIELLCREGSASTSEIAKALLSRDVSQVEYYEYITKNADCLLDDASKRYGINNTIKPML